jgi:hypothetical protein
MKRVFGGLLLALLVISCGTTGTGGDEGKFVVYVCMWDGDTAATLYEKVDKPTSLAQLYPTTFAEDGKGFYTFESNASYSGIPDSEQAIAELEGLLIIKLEGTLTDARPLSGATVHEVKFAFAELTYGGAFFQPAKMAVLKAIQVSGAKSGRARLVTMSYEDGSFGAKVEIAP